MNWIPGVAKTILASFLHPVNSWHMVVNTLNIEQGFKALKTVYSMIIPGDILYARCVWKYVPYTFNILSSLHQYQRLLVSFLLFPLKMYIFFFQNSRNVKYIIFMHTKLGVLYWLFSNRAFPNHLLSDKYHNLHMYSKWTSDLIRKVVKMWSSNFHS